MSCLNISFRGLKMDKHIIVSSFSKEITKPAIKQKNVEQSTLIFYEKNFFWKYLRKGVGRLFVNTNIYSKGQIIFKLVTTTISSLYHSSFVLEFHHSQLQQMVVMKNYREKSLYRSNSTALIGYYLI